jgi:hypothetical protein
MRGGGEKRGPSKPPWTLRPSEIFETTQRWPMCCPAIGSVHSL